MAMTQSQKEELISRAKKFFKDVVAKNHLRNTRKLTKLKSFKVNPFLVSYLSNFLTGNADPENIAKILVYNRVLGTSINTSFGTSLQKFCSDVLGGTGSIAQGADVEYIDSEDGRTKYCQIKLGPQTINKDDVETISNHFNKIKSLARTNNRALQVDDMVIGVLYGEETELSANYKKLSQDFVVLSGRNFWYHFTGDMNFYDELIDCFAEVAQEIDSRRVLNKVIKALSEDIKSKGSVLGLL